ncbi:hypothetical protein DBR28_18525 [Chryseobacterium sp. HMWF028]|nr:hypothetical protein DBR28_18525 [Chryseobacterium sp. HMWF028]
MEKFRISAQDHIIRNVVECLHCSVFGQGFKEDWNYKLINECTIEFTLKEGKQIKIADIFWFGYFTATD